jgi:geranyl-CoA carboxylase alpha subunit
MTLHRPFKSVLIANRGEIAVRIVEEARYAKVKSIAVYSDADKDNCHAREADVAVRIGASAPQQSYLNAERILAAAKATGAEAVHPGYGFLSENADFAQAVIDAGMVWVGPPPTAIRAMGDKGNAKAIAVKANLPVIPGYDGDDQSDAKLLTEAKTIGWPVLIKAALGGGGRGQRRVTRDADFMDALASARREALSAFASDRIILEKALENVRHIEVQVFADAHGNVIHFAERDCSIQRRNQKLIEEAPAPGVDEDLRRRMGEAAVRLARAVDYINAGTVEFLLDRDGQFYFLEMNTRIQVEHPVTEAVTNTNLVAMQFDVAMGRPIRPKNRAAGEIVITGMLREGFVAPDSVGPLSLQDQVGLHGHAIEARLCAEDPSDNFAPQTGHIEAIEWDGDVRAESIFADGNPASGHYDSMLVKLIAHGQTRDDARRKLIAGLQTTRIVGIRTNRHFLIDILKRDAVATGSVDIGWLEREPAYTENNLATLGSIAALWLAGSAWRSTGNSRAVIILRERANTHRFVVENARLGSLRIVDVMPSKWNETVRVCVENDGVIADAWLYRRDDRIHVITNSRDALFEDITYAPAEPKGMAGANIVRAPMAGRTVKVLAEPGAKVEKNQLLVILEAMKMEHELRAGVMGTVESVSVKPGDQVAIRQTLVTLSPN